LGANVALIEQTVFGASVPLNGTKVNGSDSSHWKDVINSLKLKIIE
jgi:hypothetical protein